MVSVDELVWASVLVLLLGIWGQIMSTWVILHIATGLILCDKTSTNTGQIGRLSEACNPDIWHSDTAGWQAA